MSTQQEAIAEKVKAEELIAAVPPIVEVSSVDVEIYDDQAGEPSLSLIFKLTRDLPSSEVVNKKLIAYAEEVRSKILESGITRFPYTRFEEAA